MSLQLKYSLAIKEFNDGFIINLYIFGSDKWHRDISKKLLLHGINCLNAPERFDEPLPWSLTQVFDTYVM